MRKRNFKACHIQAVDVEAVLVGCVGPRLVVGVDVAKEDQYAAVTDETGDIKALLHWKHPEETPRFVGLCRQLCAGGRSVEVAMEPSGTYGDPIRARLLGADIAVFRVSPKRVHDAAEVFDGVPSLHDRKAAWLIARLHRDGLSEAWPLPTEVQRTLRAQTTLADHYGLAEQRLLGQLEGICARHWPELPRLIGLTRATPLRLLAEFGSPAEVAARPIEARAFMRRVARAFLAEETIEALVCSAANQPVSMNAAEIQMVKALASEALRARTEARVAKAQLEKSLEQHCPKSLLQMVGALLAGALLAGGQDPRLLPTPAALEKSAGLNLREKSSGTKQGGLHITKRGDGRLRRLLYMLALRMIKDDPIVRAWYQRKVERQGGGAKIKAVVAVMRKLITAVWHVARGAAFDAAKLFDTRRLGQAGQEG